MEEDRAIRTNLPIPITCVSRPRHHKASNSRSMLVEGQ